ncbi:MAG: hemerythrin domain-containing protein [Polyangiaceae bacterium]|nr:hemerythrin domain-containing protein [Polyangiaceae bacterium]
MKRDLRLHGLSSDHHHALVLARRLLRASTQERRDPARVAQVRDRLDRELAPHFAVEEELLVPALRAAGEQATVERVLSDHAALRAVLTAGAEGDVDRLAGFAELLTEHVRFEERELFPLCEQRVPAAVLDEVALRAPKRSQR